MENPNYGIAFRTTDYSNTRLCLADGWDLPQPLGLLEPGGWKVPRSSVIDQHYPQNEQFAG